MSNKLKDSLTRARQKKKEIKLARTLKALEVSLSKRDLQYREQIDHYDRINRSQW